MVNAVPHTRKHALVVDDQPLTRSLLSSLLISHGIEVEDADNGETALDKWLRHKHELVFTDCHMPGMSGYTLARTLREIEPSINLQRTTIIGWSANQDDIERHQCLNAGMDDFLAKPINIGQLDGILTKHALTAKVEKMHTANQGASQSRDTLTVIDPSILDAVVPDRAGQPKVLNYLLNCMKREFKQLQQYAIDKNANQLMQTAHRMKGASKMVGAQGIASICETIEQQALMADLSQVSVMLSTLTERIDGLEDHLLHLV